MYYMTEFPNREPFGQVFEKKDREPCSSGRYWSSDIMQIVDRGHCAICKKEIVPYTGKYYQKHNDNGVRYCWMFDAAHFYCKECAENESRKEYGCFLPSESRRYYPVKDAQTLTVIEYEDGSLMEEMTRREKNR